MISSVSSSDGMLEAKLAIMKREERSIETVATYYESILIFKEAFDKEVSKPSCCKDMALEIIFALGDTLQKYNRSYLIHCARYGRRKIKLLGYERMKVDFDKMKAKIEQ